MVGRSQTACLAVISIAWVTLCAAAPPEPLANERDLHPVGVEFSYARPGVFALPRALIRPIGLRSTAVAAAEPIMPLPADEPLQGQAAAGAIADPRTLHQWSDEVPATPLESRGWLFSRRRESHHHPDDPGRHRGLGDPLADSSWRNRPLYVSLFAGGLMGDELQAGEVEQGGGLIFGGRFGGDFDHYWGLETRLAFSELHVNYPGDLSSGKNSNSYFDASLLYYPLGDARWRPYLTAGFGITGYRYTDDEHQIIRTSALALPWGVGLKYLLTRHTAIRFEVIDNFSLPAGSKADMMHNISFTGGVEIHFGGRRTSYGSW
jgi:hypothetical protein